MNSIFPDTDKRVEVNTQDEINLQIKDRTLDNICSYGNKSRKEVYERIEALDKEWDIERVLETNAAAVVILSTYLGMRKNRKWLLLTALTGSFLMQHGLFGWCPPLEFFRRLGVRTCSEINFEKQSLKNFL